MARAPASPAWRADFSRLLIVITGSINAALAPSWLSWLKISFPELSVRIVVTRSALRFVTPQALAVISDSTVLTDEWPSAPEPGAAHTEMAGAADAILVYPATMHYVARLALGIADTPSLLAIACTQVPVVVAPSFPPGGWDSPVTKEHLERLAGRSNVSVIPPVQGFSFTTRKDNGCYPPPLPRLLHGLGWITTGRAEQ
jgi:phosphopantothenoylcysteine synthetase/decarboxylase